MTILLATKPKISKRRQKHCNSASANGLLVAACANNQRKSKRKK